MDADDEVPIMKPTLTGWCEGPNHKVCHEFYGGHGQVTDGKVIKYVAITYMCTCPCHTEVPESVSNGEVRKVQRRSIAEGPVRKVPRRRS
jgi:hypothetical protein